MQPRQHIFTVKPEGSNCSKIYGKMLTPLCNSYGTNVMPGFAF